MPQNRIIILIAAAAILLDLLWFVIRGKKYGFKDSGDNLKIAVIRRIAIYLTAVALLAVGWFREFGIIGDVILAGCSVMAIELMNRDFLNSEEE